MGTYKQSSVGGLAGGTLGFLLGSKFTPGVPPSPGAFPTTLSAGVPPPTTADGRAILREHQNAWSQAQGGRLNALIARLGGVAASTALGAYGGNLLQNLAARSKPRVEEEEKQAALFSAIQRAGAGLGKALYEPSTAAQQSVGRAALKRDAALLQRNRMMLTPRKPPAARYTQPPTLPAVKEPASVKPPYLRMLAPNERSAAVKLGIASVLLQHGKRIQDGDAILLKQGAIAPPTLGEVVRGGGIGLLVGALGLGAPLGFLAHKAERKITGNEPNERERLARIKYYRDIAQQLEAGLAPSADA